MARNETKDLHQQGNQVSLQDSEITTTKVNRRSFLAKAMGAGTLAVGAAITAACGNDTCDADFGDSYHNPANADVSDTGDSCDTDPGPGIITY